jgi:hypothetical protein
LLLAQLFEAAGLQDEGGTFPTVLFDGVDVEITNAFQNVGADTSDDEIESLDNSDKVKLASLFADTSRCDAVGGATVANTSQQHSDLDDVFGDMY